MLGLGRGRWVVSQKHTLIQIFQATHNNHTRFTSFYLHEAICDPHLCQLFAAANQHLQKGYVITADVQERTVIKLDHTETAKSQE